MESSPARDEQVVVQSPELDSQAAELSKEPAVENDLEAESRLHWAAFTGKYEMVRSILRDPEGLQLLNKKNSHGETPLHGACRYGQLYICNILIQNGADMNAVTAKKSAAIHEASKGIAATSVHPEHALSILRLLVSQRAQVNSEDEDRNYPVHYICRGKRIFNKQSVSKKALKILLRAGARVDVTNSRGCNPLHNACMTGDHNVVSAICKHNSTPAFINKQDIDGQTPLHWACYFGRVRIAKILLHYGASPDVSNHGSKTPLSCAMNSAYAAKTLREIIDAFAPKMKLPSSNMKRVDSPPKVNRSPGRSRSSPCKASPRFRMLVQTSALPPSPEESTNAESPEKERNGVFLIDDYTTSSSSLASNPAFVKSVQEMKVPGAAFSSRSKDIMNELYCPLTKKLMTDPVLAADGFTYERSAIEKWLEDRQISPVTQQPVYSTSVFPNPQVRERIRLHLAEGRAEERAANK